MDVHVNTRARQLIVLAHGSRDPNWCATFDKGLVVINRHLEYPASLAYMEMAEPGLDAAIATCYGRGVRLFNVLPLFFAEGRHLLHDVPRQIEKLHQDYPGSSIRLLPAVGRQDVFWEALGILISAEYEPDFPQAITQ